MTTPSGVAIMRYVSHCDFYISLPKTSAHTGWKMPKNIWNIPVAILDTISIQNILVKQKTRSAPILRVRHSMRVYLGLQLARMLMARADPMVYPK